MKLKYSYLLVFWCIVLNSNADDIDLFTTDAMLASGQVPISLSSSASYKNQVYYGLFRPATNARWQGNLKLYQLGRDKISGKLILLDGDAAPALDKNAPVFSSSARSFWTSGKDSPDGPVVSLGGVAQGLRNYVGSNRVNLTCTGRCNHMESMTASNPNLRPTYFGATDTEQMAEIIAWSQQGHGDVIHSQPALIDYGETLGLYAFYGSNDGMFHGVKVGPLEKSELISAKDGEEQWAFTAPEHFATLGQLYSADLADATADKAYFFDGPVTSYLQYNSQHSIGNDPIGEQSRAVIFISARRGGRLLYALDVTEPDSPGILWHKSNLDDGFAELGQTWSKPVVSYLKLSGDTGVATVFMGLGYDPQADDLAGARSQGRGLMALNALTGEVIWQHTGLSFSVPAEVSVIDRDGNGYADRVYFADTGGQLWRLDMAANKPKNWQLTLLLKLPGKQKFFTAPDIITSPDGTYDAITIGSGDREKPFQTSIQDYLISYRDYCTESGNATCSLPAATLDDLQKLPMGETGDGSAEVQSRGWYLPLATGEKVVTRALTIANRTSVASYRPCTKQQCDSLGEARIYNFNPFTFAREEDPSGKQHYRRIEGGGILPPPVPFTLELQPCDGKACSPEEAVDSGLLFGPHIQPADNKLLGQRLKLWWHN
ncbi:pilus assembly protein [SAR92 clade bacterium H246]